MRWPRRILIAVSVVAAMLGVAIVLLLTMDLSRFKSNVENYVSDVTGRQFVIAGDFQPSIGTTIDLVATNIQLTNADWGTAENILELERLVVSVDTWSLLSGPIEVLDLQAEGLTLHVEKEPDTRRSSWSFGDAPTLAEGANKSNRPFELPLWLKQAHLKNIDVTYGEGWLDESRSFTISELSLLEDDSALLRMALSGETDNEAISASGLVGPLPALLDGHGPRWELEVNAGKFLVSTHGTFINLFTLEGPDIHAVMQGPEAEQVLARFGLPQVGRGPVDLEAELTKDQEGIELRVNGAFGDLTTKVIGRADSLRTISRLDLLIDVRGPDAQAVGKLFDAGFLPPEEFRVDGSVTGIVDALNLNAITVSVGDAQLKMDGKLASLDLDPDARLLLSASGTEIHDFLPATFADRVPSGAFDVNAIAVGGLRQLHLRELSGKLGEHELTVEGVLPAAAKMTGLDITVSAHGPDFEQVLGPWVKSDIAATPYVASARIHNSGSGFVVDDLALEHDSASLKLTGTAGKLPTLEGLNASIALSGDNLRATMAPWMKIKLPAVGFDVDGTFVVTDGELLTSNAKFRLGDARGTLDGSTRMLRSLNGLQINSSLTGPDARKFVAMFTESENSALVPAAEFQMGGSLSKTSAGWFVKPWVFRTGESRLEMSGALGALGSVNGLDVEVVASGPDLRRFLPERGIESALPYEIEGGLRIGADIIDLREVELRLDENSAWLNGSLPSGTKLMNVKFDFRIAGPNLKLAGQTFNIQDLAPDAFRFEGAMTRAGQAYSIDNLVAVVGENDLNGSISLEVEPKMRVTGQLDSEYLDPTRLLAKWGSFERDEGAPDPARIIPDMVLPLQVLDAADIDLTLRLKKLHTQKLDIGDVELKVVMTNDDLHLETGRVSLENGGTMNASFDLTRTGDEQANVQVNIVGEQFRLRPPIDGDGNPINRPPQDLKLNLSGSGRTIRDLAASANGSISVRQGAGDIDNELAGYFPRDLVSQVFTVINPVDQGPKYTKLQCGFFEIDVVDGIARARAAGLQTDKLVVASAGTLDLATEALDLSFNFKQRTGVGFSLGGIVNPYVKMGGTLATPALEFDKKRGFLSSTATVFTGGLSVLAQGVWDRYMSRDDYCEAVIEALDSGEIPVWDGKQDGS